MNFPGIVWICISLIACFVDETGYNEPPDGTQDPAVVTEDAVAGADEPPEPMGTLAQDVVITSEQPLGDEPTVVHVVGLEGSVAEQASVALVTTDGTEVRGVVMGSGFVVSLEAQDGDEAELFVDDLSEGIVVFESSLEEDMSGMGDPSTDEAETVWTTSDGELAVGDGRIASWQAPYLAFNTTLGASVRVDAGDEDAVIAADPGDQVCLVALANDVVVGLSRCEVVQ